MGLAELYEMIGCEVGLHCGTCRNKDAGRDWRSRHAKASGVETSEYPCPRDHQWFDLIQVNIVQPPWARRGPRMWKEAHARAKLYAGRGEAEVQYLSSFRKRIGCGDCLAHWDDYCLSYPPQLNSRESYENWWVDAHNAVNLRLGKTQFKRF